MSTGRETTEPLWPQVRAALEHALDLPRAEQDAYLSDLERGEPRLGARLRQLLARTSSNALNPSQPITALAQELAVPRLPQRGDRIGRFTIERLLGAGGMGAVYQAHDPTLNRSVAIKLIHAALVSGDYVRRFEREAHALARLRHPGIAQVYETGWVPSTHEANDNGKGDPATPPIPYIAMEFIVEARPLDAKGLSFLEMVERFQSVLSAVQHAHEHGVIHCDLKPANILLDRSHHPKLIDFGVARSADHGGVHSGRTAGTLRYMSPERCGPRTGGAAGEPSTGDTRTDVYALGVILYELIEGKSPYAAIDGSLGELLDAVRSGAITAPTLAEAPADMRADLRAILSHALALDPADRYATAAAFSEDLRRLVRHEPIAARPPTVLRELGLLARRNRVAVAATAAVLAALVCGAVAATVGLVHAQRARNSAQVEAQRAKRVVKFLEETIGSISPGRPPRSAPGVVAASDSLKAWLREGARVGQARRTGEAARAVDLLMHAAQEIQVQFADDPLLEAQLAIDLSHSLRELGEAEQATELTKRALVLRTKHLGADAEDTLRALVMLAYYSGGDPDRAGFVQEAIKRVERRFGRTDPRWFQLRSQLVDTRADLTGYESAVAESEAALAECTPLFGPDSREVQVLRFQQGAYTARLKGARERGIAQAQEALDATIKIDGEITASTIQGRFEIGMLYMQTDPIRAEGIFRGCLAAAPAFGGVAPTFCYEVRTRLYEVYMRQRKLAQAETVSREQLAESLDEMGEASYYTVKSKARVARVITWSAALGGRVDLVEAEQLARESAVDGLKYDEKSKAGNYDAYFRGIWASALILHGDAGSLAYAERLLQETIEARRGLKYPGPAVWTDAYLQLALGQLLKARGLTGEAELAMARAVELLAELEDPQNSILLTVQDLRERR